MTDTGKLEFIKKRKLKICRSNSTYDTINPFAFAVALNCGILESDHGLKGAASKMAAVEPASAQCKCSFPNQIYKIDVNLLKISRLLSRL